MGSSLCNQELAYFLLLHVDVYYSECKEQNMPFSVKFPFELSSNKSEQCLYRATSFMKVYHLYFLILMCVLVIIILTLDIGS